MKYLSELGAKTWLNETYQIKDSYNIDQSNINIIKTTIRQKLTMTWEENISDIETNPGLRLYSKIKYKLCPESYLNITNYKIRNAIAKIRLSSHTLQIEKGRHINISLSNRKCIFCKSNSIEDEVHFLFECDNYTNERSEFMKSLDIPLNMTSSDIFILLFNSTDLFILSKLGKFIIKCFKKRNV